MGKVDVVKSRLVHGDVHREAGVLHRVAGKMLDAGHRVALHPPREGGAHLPDMMGILAIGLLGAPPSRVAQDVDADAPIKVGAHRPKLEADRLTDALFEVHIPGCPSGHGHGEAGGLVHHDAPGAIGEGESGHAHPVHPGSPERALVIALFAQIDESSPERRVAIQAPQLLLGCHGGDDLRCGRVYFPVAPVVGRFGGHGVSLAAGQTTCRGQWAGRGSPTVSVERSGVAAASGDDGAGPGRGAPLLDVLVAQRRGGCGDRPEACRYGRCAQRGPTVP